MEELHGGGVLFITSGIVRVSSGGGGGPGVMLYKGMMGPAKSSGEQDGVFEQRWWVVFLARGLHSHTHSDTNTVSGFFVLVFYKSHREQGQFCSFIY